MRKLLYAFVCLIITVVAVSCTLVMDDFEVKEEDRGIEEPYTVETPYGNVTYQYNDNVTPLNGDVQNSIMMIDDSVIYLNESTPSRWIPEVGGYVAANCSRVTPTGLCQKVLSVERRDGMIKVVTTGASEAEVYKTLKINIDYNYDVPRREVYDSLELDSLGVSLDGVRDIDMSVFDQEYVRNENGGMEVRTRAGDTKNDTTVYGQYCKTYNGFTFALKWTNTVHKAFHLKYDSDTEEREEWSDTYTDNIFDVELGYGNDPDKKPTGVAGQKSPSETKQLLEQVRKQSKDKKCPWNNGGNSLKVPDLIVPVPSTPVSFIIDFEFKIIVDVHAFAKFQIVRRSDTTRQGYIIHNGKKQEVDEVVKEAPSVVDLNDLVFGGSFNVYALGRIGVGAILGNKAIGAGIVVGCELKGGVMGVLETEPLGSENDEIDRENAYIAPYFCYGGYAKGIVVLKGEKYDMGTTNFLYTEKKKTYTLSPQVDEESLKKDWKIASMVNEDGETETSLKWDISFKFSKLSTFVFVNVPSVESRRRAAVRVYSGELEEKNFVTIYGEDSPLQAGVPNYFTIDSKKDKIPLSDEYHIVPCIYDTYFGTICEYRQHIMNFGTAVPKISNTKVVQWEGSDMQPEDLEYYKNYFDVDKNGVQGGNQTINYTEFASYSFAVSADIKYATTIKEFGFIIKIYNKDDKRILRKKCRFDHKGVLASGKYTMVVDFIANCKPNSISEGLSVEATPYCEYIIDGQSSVKEGPRSKGTRMAYPYQKQGGEIPTKNVSFVNLNE